jgi:hypothetical protein
MKRMFTMILLTQVGMLLLLASTAIAHDDEKGDHGIYEEGSGGSAMEMDHKSRAMAHEYKEEGSGGMEDDHSGMTSERLGTEHSKEYYEKKYGKYEHKKDHVKEEGSTMKEGAMK